MIKSIAEKGPHYPHIDGLRGVAILMTLTNHIFLYYNGGAGVSYPLGGYIYSLCEAGNRGVPLFFLISAFTLFSSSRRRFAEESSPVRNFYLRRAFRILPLYWLTMAVIAIAFHRSFREMLPNIFMYFGFLTHLRPKEYMLGEWSIFVEESFYLFFPLIFRRLRKMGNAVLLLLATLLLRLLWMGYAAPLGFPDHPRFIELFPFAEWYCFSLGIVLFLFSEKGGVPALFPPDRFPSRIFDAVTLAALLGLVQTPKPFCMLPLILLLLASGQEGSIFNRLARSEILRSFGVCCYSIYLFHGALLILFEPLRQWLFYWLGLIEAIAPLRFLIWFPIMALINLALGLVSFMYLEQPFVRWGKSAIMRLEAWREEKPLIEGPAA